MLGSRSYDLFEVLLRHCPYLSHHAHVMDVGRIVRLTGLSEAAVVASLFTHKEITPV